jgi:hypothetical protein
MLTPPRQLIPPLVFQWVCASLICIVNYSMYLIWTLILTTDFWGSEQMWPVFREYLLLLDTWSHLWYIQRSMFALFSNIYSLWDWWLFVIYAVSCVWPQTAWKRCFWYLEFFKIFFSFGLVKLVNGLVNSWVLTVLGSDHALRKSNPWSYFY